LSTISRGMDTGNDKLSPSSICGGSTSEQYDLVASGFMQACSSRTKRSIGRYLVVKCTRTLAVRSNHAIA
jgi:hypothetical protein